MGHQAWRRDFGKEIAILCRYESDPLPYDAMTRPHIMISHREMGWLGYGFRVDWEGPTQSPFDEGPFRRAAGLSIEDTIFMTEMFWDHIERPFGHHEHSSFRIMTEGR